MNTISNRGDVLKQKFTPSSLTKSKLLLAVNGLLISLISFQIGGNLGEHSATNRSLKLCNQNPAECKFKYDILMYQETGRVPYTNKPQSQLKESTKTDSK
jgi:hypothetical protein